MSSNEIKAKEEYIKIMKRVDRYYECEEIERELYKIMKKRLRSIYHKKETKLNTKRLRNCFNIIEEFGGGCSDYSSTTLIMKYGRANSYVIVGYSCQGVPYWLRFDLECFYEAMKNITLL